MLDSTCSMVLASSNYPRELNFSDQRIIAELADNQNSPPCPRTIFGSSSPRESHNSPCYIR